MSTFRLPLFVLLAVGLAASLSHGQPPIDTATDYSRGIRWAENLEAAKAEAQQTGKLVLVHFATPTCGPCRVLDNRVFNQPSVASTVHQKYVPVKLNANEVPAIAQSFGITQVPTDVVVTPQGQVVEKLVSPATPTAYLGKMAGIASHYARRGGAGFQLAAAQSPYNASVNNPYAQLAIPAEPKPPATVEAAPPSTPVIPEMPPVRTNNPYYSAKAPAPNPTASPATASTGSRYDMPPVVDTAAAAPGEAKPGSTMVAGNRAPLNPPATPQLPTKKPAAKSQLSQAPQLPAGAAPLGFEGYCPVTMKREWKWVRGDVKWGAIHRGRTYLFKSEADRDEFLTKPDEYSPALSGSDPVLAMESGKMTPGQRKYALEYRGTFYLFSSEQTLNRFWSNAEGYAQGVRQAMSKPHSPRFR